MTNGERGYQGKPKGLRWPLLSAIAVFHLVGLYVLSRLLVPDFTASVEREVVNAFTVTVATREEPAQEPAQPEPDEGARGKPGEEAVPQPVTAPSARITPSPSPLPRASSTGEDLQSGARDQGDGTGAQGEGIGTGSGNQGGGQGNSIASGPSVRSGSLDVRRDFPIPEGGREARFGTSVIVVFTVTSDGFARDCSIARSTSDPQTAALVCGLVIEKIRFNPARNLSGQAVEARYGYRVDFQSR